jgi:hypothetical protein
MNQPERFCCDNLCEQGRDCPVRNQPRIQASDKPWVGLTEEEGAQIWGDAHDIEWKRLVTPKEIVQRISDKLKEKNT